MQIKKTMRILFMHINAPYMIKCPYRTIHQTHTFRRLCHNYNSYKHHHPSTSYYVMAMRATSRDDFGIAIFLLTASAMILLNEPCNAQLSSTFYDKTCPDALSTIRTSIRSAIAKERRMAASLIRLHFHDCFVQVPPNTSHLLSSF